MKLLTLPAGLIFAVACASHEPLVAESPNPSPAKPTSPPTPRVVEDKGLNERQIRSVVEAQYTAVRGCHTIEFSGQPATGGVIVVDLDIEPNGGVRTALVSESTFDSAQLEDCVVDVTKSLRFPKAASATEFSWVFKFRDG